VKREQLTRKETAFISGAQCEITLPLTRASESRQMAKLKIQEKAAAQKIPVNVEFKTKSISSPILRPLPIASAPLI
jgi:hypothetical protein